MNMSKAPMAEKMAGPIKLYIILVRLSKISAFHQFGSVTALRWLIENSKVFFYKMHSNIAKLNSFVRHKDT